MERDTKREYLARLEREAEEEHEPLQPIGQETQPPRAVGTVRRAVVQATGASTGKISVKLLDRDGVVTGSAFDAYITLTESAVDTTGYSVSEKVPVFMDINSHWYVLQDALVRCTS